MAVIDTTPTCILASLKQVGRMSQIIEISLHSSPRVLMDAAEELVTCALSLRECAYKIKTEHDIEAQKLRNPTLKTTAQIKEAVCAR